MFFLIPLALSLVSAGVGIYTQSEQNNQLRSDADQAIRDQQEKNQLDGISQSVEYIRTIDRLNEQQTAIDEQTRLTQAQTAKQVTTALLVTAVFMLGLTILVALKRK